MAAKAPLLKKDDFHEGCPGCLLEVRKIAAKGAPKKELSFVAVMILCNALPLSSLFPFVYFMVKDFGIAKSDTHIGTYAGYIGSALMFGRFLTSTVWGVLADKYGRKIVMLIGTATTVIFNTIFGFSTNFWVALISRFLLGFCNGTLGAARAYASEICSQEHQAFGLSMVGTMWGVGLIVGPAIGGYLAQPSEKYPSLFPSGSIFDRFPYALPCLCISVFALVGFALSLWLPESLHFHKGAPKMRVEEVKAGKLTDVESNDGECLMTKEPKDAAQPVTKSVWKNWGMVAAISVFCIWGLHDMAYSEIFSLWAVSPRAYGGLGFTTSGVGNVLAISGAALLVFQLFAFAPLANRFGAIQMVRVPAILTLPLVAVHPLIGRLDGADLWVVLTLAAVVKNLLSTCIMTGSFLLINNSVVINQRGFANGASMSFMSFFKALGPASAGALFSWAQERLHASFLPGMWIVFFLLNIVAFFTFIMTFEPMLPKSLLHPLPEERETSEAPQAKEKLQHSASFTFN